MQIHMKKHLMRVKTLLAIFMAKNLYVFPLFVTILRLRAGVMEEQQMKLLFSL